MLDLTTQESKVIIHFFHPDFRRCAVVDKHLEVSKYFFFHIFAPLEVVLTITAGELLGIALTHSGPRGGDVF